MKIRITVKNVLKSVEITGTFVKITSGIICAFMDDKSVIIYADPSYLREGKEDSQENNKKGTLTIEDAIKQLEEIDYNPGQVYKAFWEREEHESFLKKIQNARCNLVVSNYRDKEGLYDRYLNADSGWKLLEYQTKTTVGKTASDRTEVLWYNF